jgi:hypothetical protein
MWTVVAIHKVSCWPASRGAEPELLPADSQVPRRRHHPVQLDRVGRADQLLRAEDDRRRLDCGRDGRWLGDRLADRVSDGDETSGRRSGNPSAGAGRNRDAGVAMSSDWCGRVVL